MYKQRKDMKLFEEAVLLPETDKIEHKHDDGKIYTISKMIMKDYRTEQGFSHLTIVFTVLYDGKKVEAEVKYDSGFPGEDDSVTRIVESIRQSMGRDGIMTKGNIFGANMPTLTLTSPPSIYGIVDSYFWQIAPMFKDRE